MNTPVINGVAKAPLYFVMLLAIIRKDRPNFQTIAFANKIDGWMKQWTVENSYQPMVTDNPEVAFQQWWKEFERSCRSLMADVVTPEMNLASNFKFEYTRSTVVLNEQFYLRNGRFSIECKDIAKSSEA